MRSPWRIISDLANRRRQRLTEQSSDPNADDGTDRLLLPAPSDQLESLATGGDAESQSDQSTTAPDETLQDQTQFTPQVSPGEPIDSSQEDDRATPIASRTPGGTRTQSSRKTKTRTVPAPKIASRHEPDVTPVSNSMPDQLPVERTFHDNVRSVDDDIKRLRAELAAKLRLQNEQLKKMLERFDRQ